MADINEKIDQVGEKLGELNNTPDTTSEYDQDDINNNKFAAVLAFIFAPIYLIYTLIAKKDQSKFVRFHLNQGLVLWLVQIIVDILADILRIGVLRIVFRILNFLILVLVVVGVVNICTGKAKELPVIGNIKLLK